VTSVPVQYSKQSQNLSVQHASGYCYIQRLGEVCMCVAYSHEAGILFVVPTISKAGLTLHICVCIFCT